MERQKDIPQLTGIRGVAALWVLSLHYWPYVVTLIGIGSIHLTRVFNLGYLGVDLFFYLSGFILTYTYGSTMATTLSKKGIFQFGVKRFARVYPVYIVCSFIAALFYLVAIFSHHQFQNESSSNLSLTSFVLNFFGLQQWFDYPSLDGPAWSVSAEIFAYLLFPILIIVIAKFKSLLKSISVMAISYGFYGMSLELFGADNSRLIQVVCEFIMGMVACRLVQSNAEWLSKNIWYLKSACLALILFVLFFVNETNVILAHLVSPVLLFAILINFATPPTRSVLARPFWVSLGKWSYSLYLVHRLIQNVVSGVHYPRVFKSVYLNAIELSLIFIIPVILSAAIFRVIEVPTRRFILAKFL